MAEEAVKVFISYSWDSDEHKAKVLALSNSLRRYGIDCQIDRYHQAPPEGWYRWMTDQIKESDFVLVVCTEKYKLRYEKKEQPGQGRGVIWEGGLIIADLYSGEGINKKFIPILLSSEGEQYIPQSLRAYTVYRLFSESYDPTIEGQFQDLYRHLTSQPAYVAPQLGERLTLPSIQPAPSSIGNDGTVIQTTNSEPPQTSAPPERQPESSNQSQTNAETTQQQTEEENRQPQGLGQFPVLTRQQDWFRLVAWGLPILLAVAAIGGVLGSMVWRNSESMPVPFETLEGTQMPRSLQARISAGDKFLVPQEETNDRNSAFEAEKQRAVQAIANQDYEQAVTALENSIQLYKNAPETLIYLNNARIELNNANAHTIAVTAPIGSSVDDALAILRGVAQAQDEINQIGGINGVPLRIVIVNDDDNPEIATDIASTLTKNLEILGVVGHFSSGVTLATREIYNTQQLPAISATSTSVNLSAKAAGNAAGYGFRVVPNDGIAARALADYMTGTLNKQQVAVFYQQGDPYSESLKKEFTLSVAQSGGEVVGEFDMNEAGFNAETSVEQAIDNQAQVLMVAPSSQSASLEKALQVIRANNRRLQLLGGDAIYTPRLLQEGGAQLSDMVVAVFWDIDAADQASDFPERSAALWGGAEVNWITAMAYDATQAFIGAIKLNSTDVTRAKIQATLSNNSFSVMGASGTIRFLPNGDRNGKAQLVEIQSAPGSRLGYDFVPIP